MVYDVALSDTFKRVKKWIEELKAFNKNTVLAIAGNKVDLGKFDMDKEEVLQYVQEEGAKHFYTSAKTGEGLDEIFNYITQEIASQVKSGTSPIKSSAKKLTVMKSGGKETSQTGCCK